MRSLVLAGVRRDKGTRTTIPTEDGTRAGTARSRLHRCGPGPDLGYRLHSCEDVEGCTYVAFIVDVQAATDHGLPRRHDQAH